MSGDDLFMSILRMNLLDGSGSQESIFLLELSGTLPKDQLIVCIRAVDTLMRGKGGTSEGKIYAKYTQIKV